MKKLKNLVVILMSLFAITACQSVSKNSDAEQVAGESNVNLDQEERKELQEKNQKLGGSHSQLEKLYKAQRHKELLQEASKILSKDEYDLRALSVLGLYHLDQGQHGAARIFFEKALEKHKNVSGIYNNLGVIYLKEGNLESALVSFKKAYELESSNPVVQANLGSIYVKYMDYVEAEPLVEDSYSRMSDNSIVANNYAIILRTQNKLDEAEKVYVKALSRDSRNISTNLNYAILLVDYMKKYDQARQIVNKIEFLNPTDRYVLAKVRELQHKVSAAK
jgi:Flp pilus assembly protein TadD